MQISKTDFIQYLHCPKSFWLMKVKPDAYPQGEFSEYAKKLVKEGYEVEHYVQNLISARDDANRFSFQTVFETERGLYAKVDMVRENEDGSISLYEIKSSTRVKTDAKHNQIKDACFQMVAAHELGHLVGQVFIVHLNGDYVRNGEIDPESLLSFADVTATVREVEEETQQQISGAINLLEKPKIDENSCTCLTLTKANHCDSFAYFNPDIPNPSIYNLPRISKGKLATFVEDGRFSLEEIDLDEVTEKQRSVLRSAQLKEAVIDQGALSGWFSKVEYPLYFLDYETYASAIPIVNGARPQSPIPFQFSLHVKNAPEDTEFSHFQYLAEEAVLPSAMVEQMEQYIGPKGSVISWHASFENTQNKNMAKQFPEKEAFLQSLIDRTLDLEEIFAEAYVDIAFGGSTSIKKVLPVLVRDLDYAEMDVANGTDAMEAWERLIAMPNGDGKDQLRTAMLEYCELDTYAMVRLFQEMERI